MTVINGRNAPEAAGKTMKQYLEEKGYDTARIAVECNGEILPKDQYGYRILGDDDKIEIVSFVGGG